MIVREVVPGRALRGVVFPHRAPLTLREIGAPTVPGLIPVPRRRQPLPLRQQLPEHRPLRVSVHRFLPARVGYVNPRQAPWAGAGGTPGGVSGAASSTRPSAVTAASGKIMTDR